MEPGIPTTRREWLGCVIMALGLKVMPKAARDWWLEIMVEGYNSWADKENAEING